MKVITIHRLSLQFDADQITRGSDEAQAAQAIDLINSILQREPHGLSGQLIATRDEIEVVVTEAPAMPVNNTKAIKPRRQRC